MQRYRVRRGQGAQLRFQPHSLGFQRVHLRLHARVEHAGRDGVHHRRDRPGDTVQPAFGIGARLQGREALLLQSLTQVREEGRDHVWPQKLVPQAIQYPALHLAAGDGLAVGAGAAVARRRAAIAGKADHDVARAAAAAAQEPGEEVPCPLPAFRPGGIRRLGPGRQDILSDRALPSLNPLPEPVLDDAEMRDLLDDPGFWRVRAGVPLAGLGILDEGLPVPDQAANVEFVVQDAGAALPVPGIVEKDQVPGAAPSPRGAGTPSRFNAMAIVRALWPAS